MDYKEKYLKYKFKYLQLQKNINGGVPSALYSLFERFMRELNRYRKDDEDELHKAAISIISFRNQKKK